MRLLRIGPTGEERPAVLLAGRTDRAYDLSGITSDIDAAFLSSAFQAAVTANVADGGLPVIDVRDMRIGAPVARPHAIYAIGLNYAAHAREAHDMTSLDVPAEPIVFSKAPNSLCGPADDIRLPEGSARGDWEVELGVVLGTRCWQLANPEVAEQSIAGYTAVNDVSERSWQFDHGGQWLKGKSFPASSPAGPWLVTPDEIPDPSRLRLRLRVNGTPRQDGMTRDMIFKPAFLVWYLSQFVQLEPGDLIATGTPDGVGMGMSPPTYLRDGDVIDLEITGLGSHRNVVRIAPAADGGTCV